MQIRIESAKGKKDPFADKLKGQNQKLEFTLPTKNLYICDVIKIGVQQVYTFNLITIAFFADGNQGISKS